MAAAILGLLFVKLYPSSLIKNLKPKAENPIPVLTSEIKAAQEELFVPTQIVVPTIGINLAVAPGIIKDNQWTLYDDKVAWLSTSQTLGDGNVIIYGHNRSAILGQLSKLNIGDEITVKSNSRDFTYQVAEKRAISPEDVQAIISDKQQLTLYTCDGTFDQKRLIVISYPKG